jgi:hypothetical protein
MGFCIWSRHNSESILVSNDRIKNDDDVAKK